MKPKWILPVLAFSVILGNWKGYLAIFESGAQEPRQIFPTLVSSLPEADQEALASGIVIRNQRDLMQLIEDYTS